MGQTVASIIGIVIVLGLVVADIVLANDPDPDNAPSQVVRWISRYTAVVPFGLGVLAGHWFHPFDVSDPLLGSRSPLYLLLIGVGIGLLGLFFGVHKNRRITPWPWAILGAVLAIFLWPVNVVG